MAPLKAVCTFRTSKRNVLKHEFELCATKDKQARFEAEMRKQDECDWMLKSAGHINRIKMEIK
jgi:hypothetical protein